MPRAASKTQPKAKAKPARKIVLKPRSGSELLRSLKLSKAEKVYLEKLDVVRNARRGSRVSDVKRKELKAATKALRKAAKAL